LLMMGSAPGLNNWRGLGIGAFQFLCANSSSLRLRLHLRKQSHTLIPRRHASTQ
jgi:uncharacterized membrane-anchored protein